MSRRGTSSHQLTFVGTALLAAATAWAPRSLLSPEPRGAPVVLCQAALLAGCLACAYLWRRQPARSPRVGAQASAAALLAPLLATLALALQAQRVLSGESALALCLALGACAGAGLAAGLFSFGAHAGALTAAYLLGFVGGTLAPVGAAAVPGLMAVAGAGAASLALAYEYTFPLLISALGCFAGAAGVAAVRMGWWSGTPAGPSTALTLTPDRVLLSAAWALAAVTLTGGVARAADSPPAERRQPVRLLLVGSLWAGGAALLLWRAFLLGPEPLLGDARLAALVLAAAALVGAASSDAWRPGPTRLRRTSLAGVVGVAAVLSLDAFPLRGTDLSATAFTFGMLLVGAAGVMMGLIIPALAAGGGLARAADVPWLWGSSAAAGLATWMALAINQPAAGRELALAGCALALLAVAARYEVLLSGESWEAIRRWLLREWGRGAQGELPPPGPPRYRGGTRFARAVTYAGYAPWWVLGGVLRLVGLALVSLVATGLAIVRDTVGSLTGLFADRTSETTARVVEIGERELPEEAPLVELSPVREWLPVEEETGRAEKARVASLVDVVAWPILALAHLIDRATRARREALRRKRELEAGAEALIARQLEATAETIALEPAPDIVPGAAVAHAELLQRSLLELRRDPSWRRVLRSLLGWSPGNLCRQWLAPDVPEPWDDRTFRTEVIGPRGRRFELLGHVWKSARHRGCVVTVPTLPGNVDKVVEVSALHREIQQSVGCDSEELKSILLRSGFRMAIGDLMVGAVGKRRITCESPREELLEPNQDRQCDLRLRSSGGGYRCREPMPQDPTQGATTPAACLTCTFPEIWARCCNLKLEGTLGVLDEEGRLHRQAHSVCRLTGTAVDTEDCLRRDCFSPSTISRIIEVRPGLTQ